MAKLVENQIEKDDIEEYLRDYSDFSFEIKVQKKLVSMGFDCEHSGTYDDPITNKTREFDIRAHKYTQLDQNTTFRFCMAVECKNIRDNFPLIIHCMPRTEVEAYQHLCWSQYYDTRIPGLFEYGRRFTMNGPRTFYKVGNSVGKSCDQVGRKVHDSSLIGGDGDVFDKISQAINSSYHYINNNHYASMHERNREAVIISFQLPVIVVPKGRLWAVDYDTSGNIIAGPKTVPNVSYYISKSWQIGKGNERKYWYYLSHLEIVEIDSLESLINDHKSDNRFSLANLADCYMASMEKQL